VIQMERWGGAGDDWRRLERDSGACCFEPCSLLVVGSIDGSIDSSIDSSLDGWMRRKEGGKGCQQLHLGFLFIFFSPPFHFTRESHKCPDSIMPSPTKSADHLGPGGEIMGIGGMRTLLRGAAIVLYHGSVRQIIFAGHTISVRKLHFRTGGIICEAHIFIFILFFSLSAPFPCSPFHSLSALHFPLFHFPLMRLRTSRLVFQFAGPVVCWIAWYHTARVEQSTYRLQHPRERECVCVCVLAIRLIL